MRCFIQLLSTVFLSALWSCAIASGSDATSTGADSILKPEQLEHSNTSPGPEVAPTTVKREGLITFSNPKAQEFFVDGTSIPDVKFDAGPSWSGLMPISSDPNETRKLFFWFWPTNNASNVDDLVFWTNGGPGCSSLQGFLQENGPISWSWGQSAPTPNPFSWTNLSNVLWVEQPVGTGFSEGKPDISNDDELAAEVAGFLVQFLEVFSELKGSNFFLTGESYGGFYIPYIANYLYENPISDLDLQDVWIADPLITWPLILREIPALRFVQANRNVFPLNATFMAQLQNISDSCGFTDYFDHVAYPPTGQLPLPVGATFDNETRYIDVRPECSLHDRIQNAVTLINPAFNAFRITDTFPVLWSVLGYPRSTQQFVYFNRTDVQDAIHAPHVNWEACTDDPLYVDPSTGGPGFDRSVPSALSVLPNVIEKSKRTAILHGLADYVLIAEGTRMAIQNMTWSGLRGFQTPIESESFIVDGMGVMGHQHTERNLTYVEFFYSGHMTPQFVPWSAYQTIAYVLGKRESM